MIHRLGMYYLAQQLQQSQDAKAAIRTRRRRSGGPSASDREELGMLVRTGLAVASALGAVALVLWAAS